MQSRTRRLLTVAAQLGAGGLVAASITSDLAPYQVPGSTTVQCALAVGACAFIGVGQAVDLLTGTIHHCQDCSMTVRLRGMGAADARRWQEALADHPQHRLPH
ncbi:hypothetical protein [Streptomyces benahoarensis]|uniref:Uncharacterized protein n=1 Tax=Streptomyces benahoarensis TaxID=2595054 RepID=A0A553YWF8_9ACTN|nr:hypothetical protein [Streptomyces benahoarensis]TSB17774.1 hypothetical protein FNJ62_26500 [Streptomyces benahoarensis]TSB33536.1 hypothetical protein FNZ23_23435 [Streptomyces benahoarensis]